MSTPARHSPRPAESPTGFRPIMPSARYSPGAQWSVVQRPGELRVEAHLVRSGFELIFSLLLTGGMVWLVVWIAMGGGWRIVGSIVAGIGVAGVLAALFWAQFAAYRRGPVLIYTHGNDMVRFPRTGEEVARKQIRAIENLHVSGTDEDFCDFLVLVVEGESGEVSHRALLQNTSNSGKIAKRLSELWGIPHSTGHLRRS